MKAAAELAGQVGVKPACDALGVCGATFYRRLRPMTGHQQPSPTPARALSEKEQDEVFDILCSQRFVDRLLHHCHIVNIRGNSYRMRHHTELSKVLHSPPAESSSSPPRKRRRTSKETTTT